MKSRLKQQIFAFSLLAWTAVCPADAQQTRSLRDQFQNPSDEAKPWTFLVLDVWCCVQRRNNCRFGSDETCRTRRYLSDADQRG